MFLHIFFCFLRICIFNSSVFNKYIYFFFNLFILIVNKTVKMYKLASLVAVLWTVPAPLNF